MLGRLLGIQPGEGKTVLRLGLHSFCIIGAGVLLGSSAEGLFIVSYPVEWIPYVYLGGAALSLFFSLICDKLQNRFSPVRVSVFSTVGLLALLTGLGFAVLFLPKIGPFLFFLAVPGLSVVGSFERFGLIGRTLDTRSGRRLLPTLGVFCCLGALGAGCTVGFLSPIIGVPSMVFIGMALYSLTLLFVRSGKESAAQKPKTKSNLKPAPWKEVFQHRFAFLLITTVFLFGILKTLSDYQLSAAMKENLNGAEIASFLGFVRAGLNSAAFLFQLFLVRPVIARFGVGGTLIIYPLLVGAAAVACSVHPVLFMAVSIMCFDRILGQNFQKPITNVAAMPLPDAIRSRALLVIGGALSAPSIAIGSLLLMGTSSTWHWSAYAYVIAGLSAIGLICALAARRGYVKEVASAMRSRRFHMTENLEQPLPPLDKKAFRLVNEQIASKNPNKIVLALQILQGRLPKEAIATIQTEWSFWEEWVKQEAIRLFVGEEAKGLRSFFQTVFEKESDPIRAELLHAGLVDVTEEELRLLVREGIPRIRAESLVRIHQQKGIGEVQSQLEEWVESGDVELQRAAAYVIGHTKPNALWNHFPQLVANAPLEVARALAQSPDVKFAEVCVEALVHEKAFPYAKEALAQMGPVARQFLAKAIERPTHMSKAVAVLGELADADSRKILLTHLHDKNDEVRFRVVKALKNHHAEEDAERTLVRQAIKKELARCQQARRQMGSSDPFVKDAALEEFEWTAKRVFFLLPMLYPDKPFQKIYLSFFSEDSLQRGLALEALDEMLDAEMAKHIVEAFETVSDKKLTCAEEEHFSEETLSHLRGESEVDLNFAMLLKKTELFSCWRLSALKRVAHYSLNSNSEETKIVMIDGKPFCFEENLLGEPMDGSELPPGERLTVSLSGIYRTIEERPRSSADWLKSVASRMPTPKNVERGSATHSLDAMLVEGEATATFAMELWEKVFLLRSVPLFQGLGSDHLRLVADICKEVTANPGQVIVAEGETGFFFYIIATGSVEVTLKEKKLAEIEGGGAFGEMALLTRDQRTATCRAIEHSQLLTIDQIDFLDLVYTHPTLVPDISRMIAQRVFMNLAKRNS